MTCVKALRVFSYLFLGVQQKQYIHKESFLTFLNFFLCHQVSFAQYSNVVIFGVPQMVSFLQFFPTRNKVNCQFDPVYMS